eukprot:gene4769-4812_t
MTTSRRSLLSRLVRTGAFVGAALAVVKNPGYEPARDFVAVGGFATFVNAFAVSGGTPAKSFTEYVGWVKASGGGKGAVGIPAPASTPEFLVKLIGQKYQLDLVVAQPDVREHLTAMGLTVGYMSPQQLATREKAYTEAWTRIIKTSGFVAQ